MAKKKLLSEAQVRRFMGLAGMKPTTVSNVRSEMGSSYMEKDEDPADMEAPVDADAKMDKPAAMDAPDAEPMAAEPEDLGGDVEVEEEEIEDLKSQMMSFFDKLLGQADAEAPEMDDMDDMDDMEDDKMDEEEMEEGMGVYKRDKEEKEKVMDEELAEVDLQLSEEEIVQEVAKRVAKRIIKAKQAKKALDEALGRK